MTSRLLFILTALGAASLCACTQPVVEENHALREQGVALCRAGKLKEAAALFNNKLAADDKSADAHYGLATVYSAKFEEDKAIAEYDRAIELNPRLEEAYNDRGNEYLAKDLYDQAIADYTKAISLGPQHYVHWYGRSCAYRKKGEFAKARMDATEAISRAPKYAPLYLCRARVEQSLNLSKEAQADAGIALSLPASSVYEFNTIAGYLWDVGNPSLAVKQYDKVIALDPKDHEAYSARSDCYKAMGNLAKARADLNLAARYAPEPDWYKVSFLTLDDLDYDAAHAVSLPVRWALACSALMFTNHDEGCNSLRGDAATEENNDTEREALAEWWGIESREELLDQLKALQGDGGYNHTWKEYVKYQADGMQLGQLFDIASDITSGDFSNRMSVVQQYGQKFGARGILAWDLCRYVCLVRWGFRLGFVSEQEANELLLPVAKRLQSTYSSWQQMGEEYLIGRKFWDEEHWKKNATEYNRIYKLLLTEKNSPWMKIPWNTDLGAAATSQAVPFPVSKVIAAPDRVATKVALAAIGEMKASQRTIGQFLKFLAARQDARVLSEKQATLETARFVSDISDPKILLDIALAAQMKMSIYSFMPASDMALWQGLYRNCTERKSVKSDSQAQFLLTNFNCPMKRTEFSHSNKRSEILARQGQALKVMDLYLNQAELVTAKLGSRGANWTAIAGPLLSGVSDIDVLTDIAASAYCKCQMDDGAAGCLDFTLVCIDQVIKGPKSEALDTIEFFYCISRGGAATSEYLDEAEAKVLGMTMSEYMNFRFGRGKH